MSNTIFDCPDLSAFTGLDGQGLEVMAQRIEADHAVLACRITGEDRWCRHCGCQGISRDTVVRRLAHEPCGFSRTSKPKSRYKTNTFCPITRKVTLPATRSVL